MSDQPQEPNLLLNEFYDQLQDTVIEQACRLINHDLYTKAILSTLPIALVATDRSGKIRSTNRAAEDLLCLRTLGKGAVLADCFPQDQLLQVGATTAAGKPAPEVGEGSSFSSLDEELQILKRKRDRGAIDAEAFSWSKQELFERLSVE